jgi:UDP-N-acetyl-D-mannosaminuronic acid dehydrogenase
MMHRIEEGEAAHRTALSSARDITQVVLVGCGAIGFPVAVAFAARGCNVVGVDTDPARLDALRAGRVAERDEGLPEAFAAAMAARRISFQDTLAPSDALRAFILAVPTPVDADGKPVLANVEAALESVAAVARDGDLLVVRATVPIGTTRRLAQMLAERGRNLLVAACPDRTVAGRSYIEQFSVPHIIGSLDPEGAGVARHLFQRLGPIVEVSTPEAAEAAKLFANVQRDVTFALANQFALVCDTLDLDLGEIVRAGSSDYPRFSLARPGPVAGPCLTKDTAILAHSVGAPEILDVALAARRLNASLVAHVAGAAVRHIERTKPPRPIVAVLGLAFKGNPPTTDRRGSFGMALAARLREELPNAVLRLGEPTSDDASERDLSGAATGADVVVIANDHPDITALGAYELAQRLKPAALIYDTCGALPFLGTLPNGVALRRLGYGDSAGRPFVRTISSNRAR